MHVCEDCLKKAHAIDGTRKVCICACHGSELWRLDEVRQLRHENSELKKLATLRVSEGDLVIYKTPIQLQQCEIDSLREQLKAVFPNNQILVLEDGGDLSVSDNEPKDCVYPAFGGWINK